MEELKKVSESNKSVISDKEVKLIENCDSDNTNVELILTPGPQPQVKTKSRKKIKIKIKENSNEYKIKTHRKKKRSKHLNQTVSLDSTHLNRTTTPEGNKQLKKRKRKIKNEDGHIVQIKEEIENADEGHSNEKIDWPQNDLSELIKRMEIAVPDKDSLAFGTRADKLNWDDIAFSTYSGDDCKKIWTLIQKRVRRFRLLGEVLQDAKDWISKPWTNFYRGNKTKRHPDKPRRPLSVYMIFYLKKKDAILSENPGIEMTELSKIIAQMYKTISPTKREKYIQMATDERKVYEEKLEEFYRLHPEISRYVEKPNNSKLVETGPKKPLTPFGLYFEHQLKNFPSDSELDRSTFKEHCKELWKSMSDKKKVIWIDWSLDQEAKYQDELKNYVLQNPNFEPVVLKTVLTKEEKSLKERLAGKPIKPPNSAYSLFSRMMLQSEAIKKIPAKDRMKAIADQWKSCTDMEKKQYGERVTHLTEQYKLDFASYLESLPEDKRQEELQNNLPKRKLKCSNEDGEQQLLAKKKKHTVPIHNDEDEEAALIRIFESQPTHPPVSGMALYSKRYQGKLAVETAWRKLRTIDKNEYEAKVQKMKQKYIEDYEKFLKSLTKDQLTAFSQYKRMQENSFGCDSASDSDIHGVTEQE